MTTEIGCFISPHGFGHATRTRAVLDALSERIPDLHVHLFTTVPRSLFRKGHFTFTYHQVITDVGLAQNSAMAIDIRRTVEQLDDMVPFQGELVEACAETCQSCCLILCDISVLGIRVGKTIGVPSLLIENFTWDWIYSHLADSEPALLTYVNYFSQCYAEADWRIQAEPVCNARPSDLTSPPIARRIILSPAETLRQVEHRNRIVVLITMGGISLRLPFIEQLGSFPDYLFILAGQPDDAACGDNVMLLSRDTELHHPDLINMADLVVCKSGYSTIAECAQTDTPICCVKRTDFAESDILESYVTSQLNGTILEPERFFDGSWLKQLPELIKDPGKRPGQNGAHQTAAFIASLL